MAKHSHWSNIKHKKAANDAKRGKVIAKMGKLITVAVQMGGPHLDENPRLRLAVEKARAAHMANEPIDRAIKKAAGEGATGRLMEAVVYEGYAAGGVAVVVEGLTDNRTRTAPEIKKIFERSGGAMGVPGCVGWQFKDRAVLLVDGAEDQVLEALLAADCDALDVAAVEESQVSVVAEPRDFDRIKAALATAKLTVANAEVTKLPDNSIATSGAQTTAVQELLDELDDHEDVQDVYHNAEFS